MNLNLEVLPGSHLLITGPNGAGKAALFRAVAGLWDWGEGTIIRPHWSDVVFVPPRPYTVPGTLRDQLTYGGENRSDITDIHIGDSPSLRDHHDIRLELLEDGEWRLRPVRDALCA